MKLGLFFNSKNSSKISLEDEDINLLLEILKSLDAKILVSEEFENIFNFQNICYFKNIEDVLKESEIILAFGGDGTIIKATKMSAYYSKAVLGINTGYLGFLSCIEKSQISQLKEILSGNYKVSERSMLKCEHEEKTFLALNDIVLSRNLYSGVARYSVFKENLEKVCDYSSDGIVVSTPTGSTAYGLSAGGPIVCPETDITIITPICPHHLGFRSVILDNKSPIILNYTAKENSEICFFIDGDKSFSNLKSGSIKIKRSNLKAKLINFPNYNFYSDVENKLLFKKFS